MSKEFTPLPPSLLHETHRLTHLQAHTFLSTFLTTAENEPAYRPDSTLTDRGPVSVSTSGSSSLTLGNLKRILKGLEGKKVGGAHVKGKGSFGGDVGGSGDGEGGRDSRKKRWRNGDMLLDGDGGVKRQRMYEAEEGFGVDVEDGDEPVMRPDESNTNETTDGADWQDQAEFELEQDDENVDVMNEERDPGANLDQPVNEREEREMVEVKVANTGKKVDPRGVEGLGGVDEKRKSKDKRKEEKKARMKAEKVQRAEEQRKKKQKDR